MTAAYPTRNDLTARQAHVALCVILLLGALARAAVTLATPMGVNGFSDDNAYLNSAAVFLKTGYVTYAAPDTQSGVLGVGMPLLLGLMLRVFGYTQAGLLWSHIAFSFIGLVAAYGTYLLGTFLHSRRAGVVAALLTALSASMIATNSMFYTETPYLCLNLYALYFALRCATRWRFRHYLGAVACVCGAATFKGLALLAPLCVLPLIVARKIPLRRWLPKAALACAILAVVFLPWCVRNQQVVGEFTPFPVSQGDQKLLGTYVGLGAPSGSYNDDVAALDAAAWRDAYQTDVYRRIAERGALADQRSRQWFQTDPRGLIATHAIIKPATLIGMVFYPCKVFGIPERAVQPLWWACLALAAWGLFGARPRGQARRPGYGIPALYLLFGVLLTAIYVPLARYNAPHVPFVMLYAGIALSDGWARLAGARAKRGAVADDGAAADDGAVADDGAAAENGAVTRDGAAGASIANACVGASVEQNAMMAEHTNPAGCANTDA